MRQPEVNSRIASFIVDAMCLQYAVYICVSVASGVINWTFSSAERIRRITGSNDRKTGLSRVPQPGHMATLGREEVVSARKAVERFRSCIMHGVRDVFSALRVSARCAVGEQVARSCRAYVDDSLPDVVYLMNCARTSLIFTSVWRAHVSTAYGASSVYRFPVRKDEFLYHSSPIDGIPQTSVLG